MLRRLNRREYENAMNDLFGTDLKLEGMLPEDGRSHEFDVVGEALGVSMTHLQRYIDAAGLVFDAAIAKTTEAPKPKLIECNYRESEVKKEVGSDKAQAFGATEPWFVSRPAGLSGGHLREGGTPKAGIVSCAGYGLCAPVRQTRGGFDLGHVLRSGIGNAADWIRIVSAGQTDHRRDGRLVGAQIHAPHQPVRPL